MARLLLVYGGWHGQTQKIAEVVKDEIQTLGHEVEMYSSAMIPYTLPLSEFDGVIVGGGVHAGNYPRSLRRWVRRHAKELATKPTAFFSVCLGILQKDQTVDVYEFKIVENFFAKTGWRADQTGLFAGALHFTRYNWFLKRFMQRLARKAGVETEITRDYEFTNWNDVRSFTIRIVRLVFDRTHGGLCEVPKEETQFISRGRPEPVAKNRLHSR